MRRRRTILVLAAAVPALFASQQIRFAAASVRLDLHHDRPYGFTRSGPRLTVGDETVRVLITYAWRLRDFQVLDQPDWANDDGYDIDGTLDDGMVLTDAQARDAMQALLADRFHLVLSREDRPMQVYDLLAANGATRLLRPSSEGEAMSSRLVVQKDKSLIWTAANVEIASLCNLLAANGTGGTPIVDHTSLTGGYDFTLHWQVPKDGDTTPPAAPDLATALREQLGLTLKANREPVPVAVVEHLARPDPN